MLHLAVIDGVEQNANNFVASGSCFPLLAACAHCYVHDAGMFHTATKDPSGNLVNMACLLRCELHLLALISLTRLDRCRVETKAGTNMIRVSIHSGHQQVSSALLASLATVFSAEAAS